MNGELWGSYCIRRIGCFKSDTIFLPSISDIASQTGNRRGEGGGVTKLAQPHIPARHTRTCWSAESWSLFLIHVIWRRSVFSYRTVRILNRRLRCPHFCITRWCVGIHKTAYTRRQINLYRMFFDDFSVNSQPIFMKFCMNYLRVTRRLPWNFHQKILFR